VCQLISSAIRFMTPRTSFLEQSTREQFDEAALKWTQVAEANVSGQRARRGCRRA
jgi:hypothetical protein